jgi:hypothetical protein
MKTKKINKPLSLNKKTIANLLRIDMEKAVGGDLTFGVCPTNHDICQDTAKCNTPPPETLDETCLFTSYDCTM